MSTVTMRRATESDIPALEALVNLAYRGGEATVAWKNENHLVKGARVVPEELKDAVSAANSAVFVASTAGGDLIGCVQIEKEDQDAIIGMLSVHPKHQNIGLGRKLLNAGELVARTEFGCTVGKMYVLCGRPELMAWYAKVGYHPTGETKPFFGPETRLTALVEDAHFVVVSKPLS